MQNLSGWRTPETHERYNQVKAKRAGTAKHGKIEYKPEEVMKEWNYWFLIPNEFPYDAVMSKHDLLFLKREVGGLKELTEAEHEEFIEIQEELEDDYDGYLKNLPGSQSVPGRLHYHFFCYKFISSKSSSIC